MTTAEERNILQQLEQEKKRWETERRNLSCAVAAEESKLEALKEKNLEIKMRLIVLQEINRINGLRCKLRYGDNSSTTDE